MAVKRINHVALVVPDIEEATAFYVTSRAAVERRADRRAGSDRRLFPSATARLNCSSQRRTRRRGAVFGEARVGHHLCLEVDDRRRLRFLRARRGTDRRAARAATARRYLIHPRSTYGVLIELYELPASHPVARLQQVAPVQTLGRQLAIELRALRAGASAFWRALRTPTPSAPVSKANGNGNGSTPIGITIKAEGEMLEE